MEREPFVPYFFNRPFNATCTILPFPSTVLDNIHR